MAIQTPTVSSSSFVVVLVLDLFGSTTEDASCQTFENENEDDDEDDGFAFKVPKES